MGEVEDTAVHVLVAVDSAVDVHVDVDVGAADCAGTVVALNGVVGFRRGSEERGGVDGVGNFFSRLVWFSSWGEWRVFRRRECDCGLLLTRLVEVEVEDALSCPASLRHRMPEITDNCSSLGKPRFDEAAGGLPAFVGVCTTRSIEELVVDPLWCCWRNSSPAAMLGKTFPETACLQENSPGRLRDGCFFQACWKVASAALLLVRSPSVESFLGLLLGCRDGDFGGFPTLPVEQCLV